MEKTSFWRDSNRLNTEWAIPVAETPVSIASFTAQRPSPESSTWLNLGLRRCFGSGVSMVPIDRPAWLLYDLMALLYSAERDSWLISPYFVPGEGGTLLMAGQARRGVTVRVLTNSLVANDVPLVHACYRDYRAPLLAHGVQLYEL